MKVLLVEDHQDVADVSCLMLTRTHRHEVRHVVTGREAIEAVGDFQPDIVLLDLHLPDMHGYEVARRIRQEDPSRDLTIVILSGLGDLGDGRYAASCDVDAQFTKPMDFSLLTELKRNAR